jgi:hypothetical protein
MKGMKILMTTILLAVFTPLNSNAKLLGMGWGKGVIFEEKTLVESFHQSDFDVLSYKSKDDFEEILKLHLRFKNGHERAAVWKKTESLKSGENCGLCHSMAAFELQKIIYPNLPLVSETKPYCVPLKNFKEKEYLEVSEVDGVKCVYGVLTLVRSELKASEDDKLEVRKSVFLERLMVIREFLYLIGQGSPGKENFKLVGPNDNPLIISENNDRAFELWDSPKRLLGEAADGLKPEELNGLFPERSPASASKLNIHEIGERLKNISRLVSKGKEIKIGLSDTELNALKKRLKRLNLI